MKNKKKQIISGIAGVAILITGYFIYEHLMFVETDNAQVEAPTVMLAAKISGYLKEVKIVEGQKVKKDEVLVQIDSDILDAQIKASMAEVNMYEVQLKNAKKNT